MSARNVLLVVLVLVNLLLVLAVVLQSGSPREAQAQVTAGGYAYAAVTANALAGEDALWVLDLRTRKLSVFRLPQGDRRTLQLIDTRDLLRDLRTGEKEH